MLPTAGVRTKTALIASTAAIALLAGACASAHGTSATAASKPVSGGTLNMLGSGDVDYIDPNITYYSTGYLAARPWIRQLYAYPANTATAMTAVPDLATGAPTMSDGGLVATITLRSGVRWNSDPAREVTASDAIRGIKRTCNPTMPFGGLPDFEDLIAGFSAFCQGFASVDPKDAHAIADYVEHTPVSGLSAPTPDTLVIRLTHPASYLPGLLTLPALSPVPVEIDDYLPGDTAIATGVPADGPYRISSYTPGKTIRYVRNPVWQAASDPIRKAYVDAIHVDETQTQASIQLQLQAGTPDADMGWDTAVASAAVPKLLGAHDPDLTVGATAASTYLTYNTASSAAGGAMRNVEFRRAISDALDRATLIQDLDGPAINPPLTEVLPPSLAGATKTADPYPHSLTAARTALAASGVRLPLTLHLLYASGSPTQGKILDTVVDELAPLQIKVVGVASPNADVFTKYLANPDVARRGVWDLTVSSWSADWFGDGALSFFGPLFTSAALPPDGSNAGLYSSAPTDALVEAATNAATPADAARDWAAADAQVMADAAIYPITSPQQVNYHAAQVHGATYVPQLQNFDPTNLWLDPARNGD